MLLKIVNAEAIGQHQKRFMLLFHHVFDSLAPSSVERTGGNNRRFPMRNYLFSLAGGNRFTATRRMASRLLLEVLKTSHFWQRCARTSPTLF
jgi:hypothetical protein